MDSMTNPYAPPHALVLDVVDPAAGIQLADRGTRLGAAMIDGLILLVMVYLPIIIGAFLGGLTRGLNDQSSGLGSLGIGVVLACVGFIIWLAFTIKYLRDNGQSIGKKACRIKLVRRDGSPVSISRVIWLRNLLNGLLGLIPLYGIIDVLLIFGNSRRCVHDHLADTIVIKA
jgi:uncharacterized RDD family membrane protein YckC